MKRTDFLPYYLTLFTFFSRSSWPLCSPNSPNPNSPNDPHAFFSPRDLEKAMSSFSRAQSERFKQFSSGLKLYFEAPQIPREENLQVYFEKEEGGARILQYKTRSKGSPVLIIPSFLTSLSLLDLMPSHSFLSFLAQKNLRPLILDWGSFPGRGPSWTLEEILAQKLYPAYASLSTLEGPPPVVIGLFEGIFFALSLSTLKRAPSSMIFFSEPQGVFQETLKWRDFFLPLLLPILENYGGIPAPLLRFFCSFGQSEKVIQKFINFSQEKEKGAEKDFFVAVEDVLNQPRFCPEFFAKSYISGDFSPFYPLPTNPLSTTQPLPPIPTLSIQPQGRAFNLRASLYPFSELLTPPLGNLGLLTSLFSPLHVWEPLVEWLQEKIRRKKE